LNSDSRFSRICWGLQLVPRARKLIVKSAQIQNYAIKGKLSNVTPTRGGEVDKKRGKQSSA
jgi:hypothetical protein